MKSQRIASMPRCMPSASRAGRTTMSAVSTQKKKRPAASVGSASSRRILEKCWRTPASMPHYACCFTPLARRRGSARGRRLCARRGREIASGFATLPGRSDAMRALVLRAPNTAFELTALPDPAPGPGEAVARVLACGAGLTIQHVKAGRAKAKFPLVIGHEITGEIVALGAGAEGVRVGEAVTAFFYLFCGHCRWCLSNLEPLCDHSGGYVGRDCDGGYAEYIKLPARLFIGLPEGLDWRAHPAEIGVVTDALATPYKVLSRARVKAGESVAVFGAGGGLGIHQVMMARWAGARVVAVETRSEKFDACRKAGADEVVDPSRGHVT